MGIAAEPNGEMLIVEDDREFVDDLFTMWEPPLPVARASSGEEAFDYLRTSVPSLVLLDLSLPHYLAESDEDEGLKILSYLRSRVGPNVPVIVVTRENTGEMRSHAAELGVSDFIPKPFDIDNLERAVSSAMHAHPGGSS